MGINTMGPSEGEGNVIRGSRSQVLNARLDGYVDTKGIEANLANLEHLITDTDLYNRFKDRVAEILEKNPGSEKIIENETGKALVGAEIAVSEYDDLLKGMVKGAANNNFVMPTSQRIYGGKGTPQIEQDAA